MGYKAVVGSVGYGKFNQDHGIAAPRNPIRMLKRHCQKATEADLLHVCSLAAALCSCLRCLSTVALTGSTNTFHNGPEASQGPGGLVGKEFKSNTW